MDPRPDVGTAATTSTAAASAVSCDQAVFTSLASMTGSGYRLVAASRGIGPDEKSQIVSRCPSHDGLCYRNPDTWGASFYPLKSGRYCVGHTCFAGQEQTGRGGQRVYTHLVVLDDQQLAAFDCNPFAVLRAMYATGRHHPQLKPPAELEPLNLTPDHTLPTTRLTECVGRLGTDPLRWMLHHALRDQPVVVAGHVPSCTLVEALLLSVPRPLRLELSFCAGLRFSMQRRFAVSVVDAAATTQLRQVLRGQDVQLLDLSRFGDAPSPPICPWSHMSQQRWQHGRWLELARLTAREFPDCSLEALGRYGRLCTRRDEITELDCPALIELLGECADARSNDALATELTLALVADGLRRLTSLLSGAPLEQLLQNWAAIVAHWQALPADNHVFEPLIATVLKRLTRLDALNATRAAAQLMLNGTASHSPKPIRQALDDLFDHLGEWIYDHSAEDYAGLEQALDAWPDQHGLADRVDQLRAEINNRRIEAAQTSPSST